MRCWRRAASLLLALRRPRALQHCRPRWLDAADTLLAPELLAWKCANALWKKVRRKEITLNDASTALELVVGGFIELRASTTLPVAALQLGCDLDHPVYDCVYVALAEAEEAAFLTADRELVRLVLASRSNLRAHWVGHTIPTLR